MGISKATALYAAIEENFKNDFGDQREPAHYVAGFLAQSLVSIATGDKITKEMQCKAVLELIEEGMKIIELKEQIEASQDCNHHTCDEA